jgi:DNA polymerase I-like protein with 3'-5' exonuclease and polymerase domains
MAKIDQAFRKKDSKANRFKVVLTVHDEVVACVPELAVSKCVEFMEKAMSSPPSWCASLPIACEAAYGNSYGDCK